MGHVPPAWGRAAWRGRAGALALAGLLGCAVACCAVAGCSGPPAARHHRPPVSYYLALGDSLSQGVQPDRAGASVRTRQGYPDQLYALLRARQPGLRLVKLGCPGETTGTMLAGGICRYRAGSQLAAAVSFLRAHPRRVSLVTIDIGANDPDSCFTLPSVSRLTACVSRSLPRVSGNTARILTRLRAASHETRIVAMTYYLPSLAEWRKGLAGQAVARLTEFAARGYASLLTRVYQESGVRVADVFGAFRTSDFSGQVTLPRYGRLPRNVAAICQWTWECVPPPRGPNQHANRAGYAVIARAFLRVIQGPPGHSPRRNALATGPALSAPTPPPSTSTANARSPR
jgi:lysophospholipase L1-like esterase